jgi:hypothetical protein
VRLISRRLETISFLVVGQVTIQANA